MNRSIHLISFAASACALSSATPALQDSFGGETLQDAGVGIVAMQLGDMDSDGLVDVVTAAHASGELRVLRAQASGGLALAHSVGGTNSLDLVLFDADQDGNLDAMLSFAGQSGGQNIRSYSGDPNGALVLLGTLTSPALPVELVAADFDQDGEVDLVTRSSQGEVSLAFGRAGTSFAPFAELGAFASASALAVGDTTGNGAPDLVVGELQGELEVLEGGGPGLSTPLATLISAAGPRALALDDVSGDGVADVLAACAEFPVPGQAPTDLQVNVFQASGAASWSPPSQTATDAAPRAIHGADFDADGIGDVLMATDYGYTLLRGDGAGWSVHGSWAGGGSSSGSSPQLYEPEQLSLLDVDKDGDLDLLGADLGLRHFPWDGQGFRGPRLWSGGPNLSGEVEMSEDLAALDLDGDGLPELAYYAGAGKIGVLRQDGMGGALAPALFPTMPECKNVIGVELSGDGVPDLVVVTRSYPTELVVHHGDGGGGLGPIASTTALDSNSFSDVEMLAADFDGDGLGDVALMRAEDIAVLTSDGLGGLSVQPVLDFSDTSPRVLLSGDLDLDGDVDLTITGTEYPFYPLFGGSYYSDMRYRTYLGDGEGGFTLGDSGLSFDMDALDGQLVDWTGDGQLDLVVMGEYLPSSYPALPRMRVYAGDGLGGINFLSSESAPGPAISEVWIADLDGDDELDVLTTGPATIALQRGAGAGALEPAEFSYGGGSTRSGLLSDLDGDGWMDLARVELGTAQNFWQPQACVSYRVGTALPGSANYGAGTPGCAGRMGLAAALKPAIGTPDFALLGSGVAPGSLGFGYIALGADFEGSDLFGLGLVLHLDLSSGPLVPFAIGEGEVGVARAALPIPNSPGLVTQVLHAQALWLPPAWQACWGGFLGLQSTRGLRLVIQP